MKKIEIYTDGACSGNPGPGVWGVVLLYQGHRKELSGYEKDTTNNRMELYAVIQALRALKESCEITLYTDSAYVSDAFLKDWITSWQKNKWRTSNKEEVKNQDLWLALLQETKRHQVTFIRVKGHADTVENNRCDALARAQIETMETRESALKKRKKVVEE